MDTLLGFVFAIWEWFKVEVGLYLSYFLSYGLVMLGGEFFKLMFLEIVIYCY